MSKGYPERIYIFDINGTLDNVGSKPTPDTFVLPTKEIFSFLQSLKDVWAGTWSGMYPWMQLQGLHAIDVYPDFVLFKSKGIDFQDSIIRIFGKTTTKFLVVGDGEEDKLFAYTFHFDYVDPVNFFNMYKEGLIK